MNHQHDSRHSAAHRLAIAEGHIRKVRQMVDNGAYCIDVIHQSRAIQQALRQFDKQILDQHQRSCVTKDMRRTKGRQAEQTIHELMEVFEKY